MMLMKMRLDKSQVNTIQEFKTAGAFQFGDRDLAIMAGFTSYEALLVGASGGFSGYLTGAGNNANRAAYQNGPGGGGSLTLAGTLKSLPAISSVSVGAMGSDGSSLGSQSGSATAGSGTAGGNTVFNGYSAYGGEGGLGPSCSNGTNPVNGTPTYNVDGKRAGNGGSNSAGLGSGGNGAEGGYEGTLNSNITRDHGAAAVAGTFVAGGSSPVTGGGKGGGGGSGFFNGTSGSDDAARSGATGANTAHADSGAPAESNRGGSGGGADLFALTGIHEYYGSKGTGLNGQGAVVIKIS